MRIAALVLSAAAVVSAQAVIEGTVVNSVTRAGIEGVDVRYYTSKGVRYTATTTSGGIFRLEGIEPGSIGARLKKTDSNLLPRRFPSPFPAQPRCASRSK